MNGQCKHHFITSAEELRISTQTLSNSSDDNDYKQLKISIFLLDDHILPVMKQLGITESLKKHLLFTVVLQILYVVAFIKLYTFEIC